MFLQWLWFGMIAASLLWGTLTGQGNAVLPAALEGTRNAITISLQLLSGYLFFCGLIAIVNKLEIQQKFCHLARPVIDRLLGGRQDGKAAQAVCMNLSANLLGLGNAATPAGIEAAKGINRLSPDGRELCRLVVMNTASIQLLPTTVAAVRAAAGCQTPFDILPCVWLASICSVAVGLAVSWLLSGRRT